MTGPVPTAVRVGAELVSLRRCWPSTRRTDDGTTMLRFEGLDETGRVRAGHLYVDPGQARGMVRSWQLHRVELTRYGQDRKLPGLQGAATEGQVVVHRVGRRAVVRAPDRFIKVVRPEAGARLAEQSAGGYAVAAAAGFAAPAVLARDEGRLEMAALPGASLHDAGATADPADWDRWWGQWATRWPALVRGHRPGRLGVHGPVQEQQSLLTWVDHAVGIGIFGPLEHRLSAAAARTCELLATGSGPLDAVSHRDLHDKQILVGDGQPGLLDFDTVALAEPALDLANLAVHARLRAAQGLWSSWHADAALAHVHAVAEQLVVPAHRLAAYAEATRLRLACLYAFRPRWHRLAISLLLGEDHDIPGGSREDEKTLIDLSSTSHNRPAS